MSISGQDVALAATSGDVAVTAGTTMALSSAQDLTLQSTATDVSLTAADKVRLVANTGNVELGASMDAGVVSGLFRSALGGESLFSQTLTAVTEEGGRLFFGNLGGDYVSVLDLDAA